MTNHPRPDAPLTCSEVVERLDEECVSLDEDGHSFLDHAKAELVLHSWRERRVQELEELLAKRSLSPELLSTQLDTTKEKI